MQDDEGSWSNDALEPSAATAEDIERYCGGECHVFAVALSRLTGWPMHVVTDEDEPYWSDEDGEDMIPSVIHVLCMDEEGRFWDVRGCRPGDTLFDEMTSWQPIGAYGSDTHCTEADIRHYTGCWGEDEEEEIDRPLAEFSESDVDEATETVRRVLGAMPGFRETPAFQP
jgi:hypothetical protein